MVFNENYANWLMDIVGLSAGEREANHALISHMIATDFHWIIANDENRAEDGLTLRRHYGYSDSSPCCVFEMIVAIADRMEKELMHDDDLGNRTHIWFVSMINNLGFSWNLGTGYSPIVPFDDRLYAEIIDRFLNRRYSRNGKGGLFLIKRAQFVDMRKTEIWYQMQYYVNDIWCEEDYDFV